MHGYSLLLVALSLCSFSEVSPFGVSNGSPYNLSFRLSWQQAATGELIQIAAGDSVVIPLDRTYEALWVTLVWDNGSQEEPFKLVPAAYETDKMIDNDCFLLITTTAEKELQFNLIGKRLAKAIEVELIKYQQKLIAARTATEEKK